jgi:hypothetical protein
MSGRELEAYFEKLIELKPRLRVQFYKDGSFLILGLAESERARLGDKLFEGLDQALFELEEGYRES